MNKFLVMLMMVLFSFSALAQHRGGHGRGHGRGGDWGRGDWGRGDHGRHYPNPGRYPYPNPGRNYPYPGNGGYRNGSCVVAMVNALGFTIETYYGYNDYYNRGCSSALRQCQLELNHRGYFRSRCIVRY